MKRGVGLLIPLLIFFTSYSAFSIDQNPYLLTLIDSAIEQKLYKDRYWTVLLHYKKKAFGVESLVDDPAFFLSPSGKKDPQSELIETIRSFFKKTENEDDASRCRFPARYAWLKEVLNIDEGLLPSVQCPKLEDFLRAINPRSATLVFPTAYMNSPASMFGHTLIRIDSNYRSKLMSYAVNYAANTGDEGGVAYIIKGLFGYFKGYFSILPYYEKIEEYNDLDMRDMWEYELNLTEDEVLRMVLHIWELKDIYSYYYFFDENCSYNLLFLIEAARPEVNLTDQFGQWVIPSDTVMIIIKNRLVSNIVYRPSRSTKIRHLATYLSKDMKKKALEMADGNFVAKDIHMVDVSDTEKTIALDIATEMTQYKFTRQLLGKKEYQRRFLDILNVRKEFGMLDRRIYDVSLPPRPDEGHLSSRFGTGIGIRGDEGFQIITFRPAYHDLADSDEGYHKGSQIIFGNIELRYNFEKETIQLQSLDIIDIVSLGVRDEFFKPTSWKIYTGLRRQILHDRKEHLLYTVNPGFGLTGENKLFGLYFIFIESDFNTGRALKRGYSAGIGISTGLIKNLTDRWKLLFIGRSISYELGDHNKMHSVSLIQNYKITKNLSMRPGFIRYKTYSDYYTEMNLLFYVYF